MKRRSRFGEITGHDDVKYAVDPGRAHPYVCPAGYWTIGYGHLCDPKHPPITEAEAEGFLAADLKTALNATLRYCPVLATELEGRLAAIVDFTFNLGAGRLQTSTLRRRVNQRDWAAASTPASTANPTNSTSLGEYL